METWPGQRTSLSGLTMPEHWRTIAHGVISHEEPLRWGKIGKCRREMFALSLTSCCYLLNFFIKVTYCMPATAQSSWSYLEAGRLVEGHNNERTKLSSFWFICSLCGCFCTVFIVITFLQALSINKVHFGEQLLLNALEAYFLEELLDISG